MITRFSLYGLIVQCIFLSTMLASPGIAQIQSIKEVKIDLKIQDKSLETVLKMIESKTDFKFVYSAADLDLNKRISINSRKSSVSDVLLEISRQANLKFRQVNENISVQVLDDALNTPVIETIIEMEQSQTITGRVTTSDDPGGLPGVNVILKGTAQGTVTDINGNYSIEVPGPQAVLVFSSVGYLTEEEVVGGRSVINMVLAADITSLEEIVVVGYGVQSRKNLTSAVSSIGPEELNRGAISDVGQLLQGKVPGLNITRSGDPNRNAAIILRGASTLRAGAQSPLFVIDGVIGGDISLIAPDDIVSIDVLKDAAATAIYGNRAANGVIMVSTRRAEKGQMQMTYSGYVGVDRVSNQLEMMDANQLRNFLQRNNQNLAPQDDLGANTNWQNEVQRASAISQNHNISLGGGTDKTLYSASLNYFDQEGVIKGSSLKRIIARLSVEQYALRDKLKVGFNVSNSFNDAQLVPYRNTVLSQMITYLPTVPVRRDDGSFYDNFERSGYFNPVSMIENGEERSKYNIFLGTAFAQLQLPFGLTYDVNFSYQSQQTNYGSFYNSYYTEWYNNVRNTPDPPASPMFVTLTGVNGQAMRSSFQNTNTILETFLTWNKDFGDHNINAVVGYSWQENILGDGFQATSTNFPVDDVSFRNLGLGNPYAVPAFRVDFGGDPYQQIRLISDFARVNYNYNNRYLIQASIRRDGSSAFGVNNRWGYFPSVGAAWRISQEAFMQNNSVINELKLRASYGVTGNSFGFSPYTTRLIYGTRGLFYFQGTQTNAIGVVQNENPDLRWEKTATSNLGLDFAILNNRLSGTLEVYNKRTTDLIWTYNVSTNIYPHPNLTTNVGEMTNKGVELLLNFAAATKGEFKWNTSLNLAHNRNTLVSLTNANFPADSILLFSPDGAGQSGETVGVIMQGQPLGSFFTYRFAGLNDDGVSQFYDHNGELTINPQQRRDYQIVGNAQPDILIGWSNNFSYKNWDLNVFFRSVLGNEIMNVTMADLHRPNTARLDNIPVSVGNEPVSDFNSYRYSSRFVESGSFVRLDNATLGYTFRNPGQDIRMLRVYLSGNNLFLLTNYTGIDPEIDQGGLAPGIDARNFYPKTRTLLIGVNVTF
ncbi:MAG: SusC/RagA family TonB-linked outer membrane protein [Cyclobacteriaceae bacterium]|nr:SusC/RagA family TonB-linked outer membrane protein [Cyclobacteriaceae bacterium]